MKIRRLCQAGLFLIGVVGLAAYLRGTVVRTYLVNGVSMEPSLLEGDLLLVDRWSTRDVAEHGSFSDHSIIRRGDIVVIRIGPGSGGVIAKRVIGLPGDTVSMDAGRVLVNGRRLEERYKTRVDTSRTATLMMEWQSDFLADVGDRARYFPTSSDWGPLYVPSDRLFVLGDNRPQSVDSRELGMAKPASLIGIARLVLGSHDGSCCRPRDVISGVRWERFGLSVSRL